MTNKATFVTKFYPIAASGFSDVFESPHMGFDYEVHTLGNVPVISGCDIDLTVQSILMLPEKERHSKPACIIVPWRSSYCVADSLCGIICISLWPRRLCSSPCQL
jgi:hypothetical protein